MPGRGHRQSHRGFRHQIRSLDACRELEWQVRGRGQRRLGRKNFLRGIGAALQHHYATASTDTGHEGTGGDAKFAFGHPEKLVDFAERSVHEMTVQAKAIIAAYYGAAPRYSYWNGCSTGGRQGLMEAQRFPHDYNGIAAGAPANYWTHLMFASLWPAKADLIDPASYIPPSKYELIQQAALAACDALDGVTDHIINDPTRCHFDPGVLTCKGADAADCLTAPQVKAVRMIYAGPTNPRTGEQIFPGLEPGSEIDWKDGGGRTAAFWNRRELFPVCAFQEPPVGLSQLNFDQDVALADQTRPRPHQCHQPRPQSLSGQRRQASALSRLDRQPDRSRRERELLPERGGHDGWRGNRRKAFRACSWCREWTIAAAAPAPTTSTKSACSNSGWNMALRPTRSSPRIARKVSRI